MENDDKSSIYGSFASVYDIFMDNIPYEEWCGYLLRLLKKYGVEDGIVLDIGCGTGNITRLLSRAGFDMIGIDYSEEMLAIAKEKAGGDQQDILYLLQDMREFELYGTVSAAVSLCDSMNYILEEEELLTVFKLVNNYLDPGGLFIFDLNTAYKYSMLLGDRTIAESREDSAFIWDNYYDGDTGINEYVLSLFIKDEGGSRLSGGEPFLRFEEIHYQRAYDLSKIRALIEAAGMEWVAVYDAFTYDAPKAESERVYVIARERGKEKIRE